jgi:hypothetical protein
MTKKKPTYEELYPVKEKPSYEEIYPEKEIAEGGSAWFPDGTFLGEKVPTGVQDTVGLVAGFPVGGGRKHKVVNELFDLTMGVGSDITKAMIPSILDSIAKGKETDMKDNLSAIHTDKGTLFDVNAIEELVDRQDPVNNVLIETGLRNPSGNGVINRLVDANIVDEDGFSQNAYNMLANEGRDGDTELAYVDDELAHVNQLEKDLINRYGDIGEQLVEEIGAGTINPETGLKEYRPLLGSRNWKRAGSWLAGEQSFFGRKGPLFGGKSNRPKWQPSTGQWGIFGSSSASDERLRLYGSRDKDAKEKWQARQVVQSGMDNLANQLSFSLGEGGTIQQTEDIGFTKADQSYNQQVRANKANVKKVIGGSNLAAAKSGVESGLANQAAEDALGELEMSANLSADERQLAQEELRLTSKRSRLDLASRLQNELNNLMLTYQQTTKDAWSGGYEDELQSKLDQLMQET